MENALKDFGVFLLKTVRLHCELITVLTIRRKSAVVVVSRRQPNKISRNRQMEIEILSESYAVQQRSSYSSSFCYLKKDII